MLYILTFSPGLLQVLVWEIRGAAVAGGMACCNPVQQLPWCHFSGAAMDPINKNPSHVSIKRKTAPAGSVMGSFMGSVMMNR
jgi:hypothetical protein